MLPRPGNQVGVLGFLIATATSAPSTIKKGLSMYKINHLRRCMASACCLLLPTLGADQNAKELRAQLIWDRVNTVGTTWLGMTLECAQCHTHKFDPISITDYYRFYAYFDRTAKELTKVPGSHYYVTGGVLELPTTPQRSRRERELREAIAAETNDVIEKLADADRDPLPTTLRLVLSMPEQYREAKRILFNFNEIRPGAKVPESVQGNITRVKELGEELLRVRAPRSLVLGEDSLMPPRKQILKSEATAAGNNFVRTKKINARWIDESIGALVRQLQAKGLYENTVIIFVTDQGMTNFGKFGKDSPYNSSVAIPMVIHCKARITKGIECDQLVQNIDIPATLFSITRATVPRTYSIAGVDLTPLFTEPGEPVRDCAYGEIGSARDVITQQWKYIAVRHEESVMKKIRAGQKFTYRLPGEKLTFPGPLMGDLVKLARNTSKNFPGYFDLDQLYDLQSDPGEVRYVVAEHAEVAAKLKDLRRRELQRSTRYPFGEFTAPRQE